MALADKFTLTRKKFLVYSDFTNNFDKNPFTGFLAKSENEQAVKQSIKNILQTMPGERFYDSNKASKLWELLFENPTSIDLHIAEIQIKEVLATFEPRAIVHTVDFSNPEFNLDRNELTMKIVFSIQNLLDERFELDFTIKRVR